MPTKIIADCATGEVTEVELTAEEVTQLNADTVESETRRVAEEAAATAKATDAAAGKAKLKELGLTDDQIAALVG
jgi:hypothetical protein